MVSCSKLTKSYGDLCVIDSLSLQFRESGFYLLLGESGSGKTTFLNLLAGFLPFDQGSIWIDGTEFQTKVKSSEPSQFEYITQDSFFADYLNVRNNLLLLGATWDQILPLLEEYGLKDKEEDFPGTLSGGERARLAVIRALLKGKRILLMDEPTAALDEENKRQIFEMIRKVSRNVLVICASHDEDAVSYSDAVLRFSKSDPTPVLEEKSTSVPGKNENQEPMSPPALPPDPRPYLKPWFSSSRREKGAKLLYLFFLTLSLLLLFLADTPAHKIHASCENMYRINALQLSLQNHAMVSDFDFSGAGIREVVPDYFDSCPNQVRDGKTLYSNQFFLLPESEKNCKLSSRIRYGSYYTAPEQVILTLEMAQKLSPRDPSRMIGKTISVTLYGMGRKDLVITGIWDELTIPELLYLNGCGARISLQSSQKTLLSGLFFINAALVRELVNDPDFYRDEGQRSYFLYFDSYRDLARFVNQYEAPLREKNAFLVNLGLRVETRFRIEYFSLILLPFALLIALFTAVFYTELYKTEFIHNNAFVSVFEYAGYSKKLILKKLTCLCLGEFMKILAFALLLSFGISFLVNWLNHRYFWVEFELFSYHPVLIPAFCVGLILFILLSVHLRFRKVRTRSWYDNLMANRDVL